MAVAAQAAVAQPGAKNVFVMNSDGQINMTTGGQPITNFFEKAARAGKSMGAVSSVQITHATPAAVCGHNVSRNNYTDLGAQYVYSSNPLAGNAFYNSLNHHENFTVLLVVGHGDYENNGNHNAAMSNACAGGNGTWADIIDGAAPNDWTFVENKVDCGAVANGVILPGKLMVIAQVNCTLRQSQQHKRYEHQRPHPGDDDQSRAECPGAERLTQEQM